MPEPAIEVEGLHKKYSRNSGAHLSYGLWDLLAELRGRHDGQLRQDEFYAVQDVSFNIQPGDSFALIGRNGSGKTTVLKMLNGLIKPDGGRITMRGRVQALINLGAGFSARLSGRENIYNSAALIGFNHREITAMLDEIVHFAELEDFIDTPVGAYSSGMKARLGFAVAVNLKPHILLIDEILSVGDYAFQAKCYARMEQLKKDGTTIVFVSHSRTAVVRLCERALWMHQGVVRALGPAVDAMKQYIDFLEQEEGAKISNEAQAKPEAPKLVAASDSPYGILVPKSDDVEGIYCKVYVNGAESTTIPIHSALNIEFGFELKREVQNLEATLNFHRKDGTRVAAISSLNDGRFKKYHKGHIRCRVQIPDFDFVPGHYVIVMPISEGQNYLWRGVACEFHVEGGGDMYFGIKDIAHTFEIECE